MQNIIHKRIKDLHPYKNNAKKHPKEQVEQIANSIKEFGFTQPVLIDENNNVIAGHGRILGAKKAGLKSVPTVCLNDLTEEQIKAYRLADNKLNESEWDFELLDEELNNIFDIDMENFGFNMEVEIKKYDIEARKAGKYKHKHFLVTFSIEDKGIEKFKELLEKEGLEYVESNN